MGPLGRLEVRGEEGEDHFVEALLADQLLGEERGQMSTGVSTGLSLKSWAPSGLRGAAGRADGGTIGAIFAGCSGAWAATVRVTCGSGAPGVRRDWPPRRGMPDGPRGRGAAWTRARAWAWTRRGRGLEHGAGAGLDTGAAGAGVTAGFTRLLRGAGFARARGC